MQAILTRKVLSPMGEDEFIRVTLGQVGERGRGHAIGAWSGRDHVAGQCRRHRHHPALL